MRLKRGLPGKVNYGKQKSVPPLNAREKGHENNKV
jgi:hypothetical protein